MKLLLTTVVTTAYIALCIWGAGFVYFSYLVSTISPQLTDKKADAIIVLTGGAGRINAGVNLLNDKIVEKLFISGVDEAVTLEALATLMGRDPDDLRCCVVLGHMAQTTAQNADEVAAWAKKEKAGIIILVTSDYHMPRAWMEFRRDLPDRIIIRYPVKTYLDEYRRKGGRTRLIFEEYNKTIFTWLRLVIFHPR